MTNKEAKEILEWELNNFKYTDNEFVEATKVAIKALDTIERLKDMRDNAYRLYCAEDGKSDYSYGRKQVIGTVHSDLEELLDDFER